MLIENRKSTSKYYTLVIGIPILVVISLLLVHPLYHLMQKLPICPIYRYFNLLCPGCGITRSFGAFIDGNIPLALHYNPVPYLVLIFGLLAYIQLCLYTIGKPIQLLPRKLSFYLIIIAVVMTFLIARNFIPTLFP